MRQAKSPVWSASNRSPSSDSRMEFNPKRREAFLTMAAPSQKTVHIGFCATALTLVSQRDARQRRRRGLTIARALACTLTGEEGLALLAVPPSALGIFHRSRRRTWRRRSAQKKSWPPGGSAPALRLRKARHGRGSTAHLLPDAAGAFRRATYAQVAQVPASGPAFAVRSRRDHCCCWASSTPAFTAERGDRRR
jgi:hypothetical protein